MSTNGSLEATSTSTADASPEPRDITTARLDAPHTNNDVQPSSTPVEMSNLNSRPQSGPHASQDTTVPPHDSTATSIPNTSQENQPPASNATENPTITSPENRQPLSTSFTNTSTTATVDRKISTAIGPSTDQPILIPKEPEALAPSLMMTLLLTTGARHPFKIDEKYLKKRNVNVTANDPFNMSVYTLKELIWREWREGKANFPQNRRHGT